MITTKLTLEQIKKDNPHFGPKIRFIEFEKFSKPSTLGFICAATFGAKNSEFYGGKKGDAWARYVWSPERGWCLGDN